MSVKSKFYVEWGDKAVSVLGDFDIALEMYDRAIKIDKNDMEAYGGKCGVLIKVGDLEKALIVINESLKNNFKEDIKQSKVKQSIINLTEEVEFNIESLKNSELSANEILQDNNNGYNDAIQNENQKLESIDSSVMSKDDIDNSEFNDPVIDISKDGKNNLDDFLKTSSLLGFFVGISVISIVGFFILLIEVIVERMSF